MPPHNPIVLATTRAPPAGLRAGRGRVCVGSVARGEEMGPSRSPPPAAHRLRNSNQIPWNVTRGAVPETNKNPEGESR